MQYLYIEYTTTRPGCQALNFKFVKFHGELVGRGELDPEGFVPMFFLPRHVPAELHDDVAQPLELDKLAANFVRVVPGVNDHRVQTVIVTAQAANEIVHFVELFKGFEAPEHNRLGDTIVEVPPDERVVADHLSSGILETVVLTGRARQTLFDPTFTATTDGANEHRGLLIVHKVLE